MECDFGNVMASCYNPEINWRTEEMKMKRCLEKCGKQWRLKQEKSW